MAESESKSTTPPARKGVTVYVSHAWFEQLRAIARQQRSNLSDLAVRALAAEYNLPVTSSRPGRTGTHFPVRPADPDNPGRRLITVYLPPDAVDMLRELSFERESTQVRLIHDALGMHYQLDESAHTEPRSVPAA